MITQNDGLFGKTFFLPKAPYKKVRKVLIAVMIKKLLQFEPGRKPKSPPPLTLDRVNK